MELSKRGKGEARCWTGREGWCPLAQTTEVRTTCNFAPYFFLFEIGANVCSSESEIFSVDILLNQKTSKPYMYTIIQIQYSCNKMYTIELEWDSLNQFVDRLVEKWFLSTVSKDNSSVIFLQFWGMFARSIQMYTLRNMNLSRNREK